MALDKGHKPYAPIDLAALPAAMPPAIEPARLEARVNEFYRKMEQSRKRDQDRCTQPLGGDIPVAYPGPAADRPLCDQDSILLLWPAASARAHTRRDSDRGRDRRDRDGDWDQRDRDRDRDSHRSLDRERSDSDGRGSDRRRDDERWHNDRYYEERERERDRERGFGAPSMPPPPSASRDRSIDEDNVGYGMLKGMGWQEGTGLGAQRSGRAEPIRDDGQMDKVGLGSRSAPTGLEDHFASFREMRSGTYHRKMADR